MYIKKRKILNFAIIARLLGILLLIEAAFMLVPFAVCFLYEELETAKSFGLSILITVVVGLLGLFCKTESHEMGKREGFLLTGLTWVVFSFFGMLPFLFYDTGLNVASAFFETMSGLTTTGASTIASVEAMPHGILLWRAITHFIGGMGIILFTLAIIPMLNKQSGIQLFNAEVTGITHEKVRPRISHTAKTLWLIYIILNILLIAALWIGPMNLFEAICHSFSTIATGGFSTRNDSIIAFDSNYVKIVITIFMFLAGINFSLFYHLVHGDIKSLIKSDITRWYIGAIIILILAVIGIELLENPDFSRLPQMLIDIPFQIVSSITSTGFNATNFTAWQHASIIVLILGMIMGSCAGSTAGGIKIDRVVLICKNLKNELHKLLHPNTVLPLRINGKILGPEHVLKVSAFLLLFVLSTILGMIVLTLSGLNLQDGLFASLSCICNNGLGWGFTSVSYAGLNDISKWVMSALMLIGRLEIFTVMVLFSKSFWSK